MEASMDLIMSEESVQSGGKGKGTLSLRERGGGKGEP